MGHIKAKKRTVEELHVTRHDSLFKTILQGTLEGGCAEKMLDGQHQKVDIPVHARTARKVLLQKKDWRRIFAELSLISPLQPPPKPDDKISPESELNSEEHRNHQVRPRCVCVCVWRGGGWRGGGIRCLGGVESIALNPLPIPIPVPANNTL